jgi:hypothetical protein
LSVFLFKEAHFTPVDYRSPLVAQFVGKVTRSDRRAPQIGQRTSVSTWAKLGMCPPQQACLDREVGHHSSTVSADLVSRHFESSVPGLYFIGTASALSFGPAFRFVLGADFTARAITRQLAGFAIRRGGLHPEATPSPGDTEVVLAGAQSAQR